MSLADLQTATVNLQASLAALESAKNAKVGAQVTFDDAQQALTAATASEADAFLDAGYKLSSLLTAASAAGVTPVEPPVPSQSFTFNPDPRYKFVSANASPVEELKLPSFGEIAKIIGQIQQLLAILQAVVPKG